MSATDLDTAPSRTPAHGAPVPTLGHVHLKVANLDRALGFYRDLLGFELMERMGEDAAFLASDGYHHHLALNTWETRDASPPPAGHTGLYHTAFLYKDRADLGAVVQRVLDAGYRLDGAADHGVSEAVYLRDPDENGVELYRDRPRSAWPRKPDGSIKLSNQRLDIAALLAEARREQS
ncbi:VOC family protein [Dinoroseobacter sp. S124A]|uniref:VOC family protein n=1 Tax=Dinoroseobacter sp. S124A TaxID=3415128 RepID=UPI003C7B969F